MNVENEFTPFAMYILGKLNLHVHNLSEHVQNLSHFLLPQLTGKKGNNKSA